ncbi:MAG: hypothetical protein NDI61_12965 [Bdellovibrionaceae bacterium]|nr:hypothetical protein [Pseudobdellovibrionaceae bacterium]
MKKMISICFMALSCLAMSSAHAEPSVITVYGSLSKSNDSACPLRPFQYFVSGDFRTSKGAIANFGGCLESVAIPLFESLDQLTIPSQSGATQGINRVIDAESVLAKNVGRTLKMRFVVNDADQLTGGLGTLLSIEESKK